MKKVILTVAIFMVSNLVFAKMICLDFKVDQQGIKQIIIKNHAKANFYNVTVKHAKGSEEGRYSCHLKDSYYQCFGDDDSGRFKFSTDKKILDIDNMTLGEPDSKFFKINKTGILKGINCKMPPKK